ncbi:hypothetical protein AB4Z34_16890 [Ensifer sp. 2YAB10]|uniref:hypothetical protein n=1 Tax=unclassified Ensifer TaxID=2633371 RepID=UPI003F8E468E
MVIKAIWTDVDFNDMGWHDCRLYGIKLLDEGFNLSLDIDYMFRWPELGFGVSPCVLKFFNVFDLKIDLDYDRNLLCFISDINRLEARSPNGRSMGATNLFGNARSQPRPSGHRIAGRPGQDHPGKVP